MSELEEIVRRLRPHIPDPDLLHFLPGATYQSSWHHYPVVRPEVYTASQHLKAMLNRLDEILAEPQAVVQ